MDKNCRWSKSVHHNVSQGTKNIGGITKADLTTVDRKKWRAKKSRHKKVGYKSPSEGRQRPAGGAKGLPAHGQPGKGSSKVTPLTVSFC